MIWNSYWHVRIATSHTVYPTTKTTDGWLWHVHTNREKNDDGSMIWKNRCRQRMKLNTHHQGKDVLHSMLKFFPSPRAMLNGRWSSVFPWSLRFLEGRLEKKSTRRHIPSSQMTTVDTVHRISFFYCWRHEVRLLTLKSDDDLDVRCGLIYRARLWFYYSSQLYYRMEWSGSSWSKKTMKLWSFFYFLWVICSS